VSSIEVLAATYGNNIPTLPKGNVTAQLAAACNGRTTCTYEISVAKLGNPADGRRKTFVASYRCTGDAAAHHVSVPAEADGRSTTLSCAKAHGRAPSN
jgi:hypothetical protein